MQQVRGSWHGPSRGAWNPFPSYGGLCSLLRGASRAAASAERQAVRVSTAAFCTSSDVGRFRSKRRGPRQRFCSIACFLIAHPKGTLIWDACTVPDGAWKPTGTSVDYHIVLPDSQQRDATVVKPLLPQLAAVGYAPSDITFFALSHFHYDHTGNANAFSGSTWLVRQTSATPCSARPRPRSRPPTQPSRTAKPSSSRAMTTTSSATAPW